MEPNGVRCSVETRNCCRGGKVECQVTDVCAHRLLGFGERVAIGHGDTLGEGGQGAPAVPDNTDLPVVTANDLIDTQQR